MLGTYATLRRARRVRLNTAKRCTSPRLLSHVSAGLDAT